MSEFYLVLAEKAAQAAADKGITNIDPKWIYSQWVHESNNFTSELAVDNNNLGGLTQTEPNDTPQPDGNQYYIKFDNLENYATFFGHYLRYFLDSHIDQATTLAEYITALKNSPSGEYFGDDLDAYLADCERIYSENFA